MGETEGFGTRVGPAGIWVYWTRVQTHREGGGGVLSVSDQETDSSRNDPERSERFSAELQRLIME